MMRKTTEIWYNGEIPAGTGTPTPRIRAAEKETLNTIVFWEKRNVGVQTMGASFRLGELHLMDFSGFLPLL